MTQSVNPTTRTNPADILREALAGRSAIPLPQLIQQLRAAGMTAAELAKTFGNLGIAPEVAAGILGTSTGVLGKGEFIADYAAALGKREGAIFIERTGYAQIGGGLSGGATHSTKVSELGATLANAHTFEQKVYAVELHFAHGGNIADAMQAMGVPKDKAEQIRMAEEKANREYDEKHADEKEILREKYRKQGLAEEKARQKAQEEYEAIRKKAVLDQMKRDGTLDGIPPSVIAVVDAAASANAEKYDVSGMGVAASAKDSKIALREIVEAKKRLEDGTASTAEITTLKGVLAARRAAQGGNIDAVRTELDTDAEAKAIMLESVFKDGAKAADKVSAAALLAKGVITEGEVGGAKKSLSNASTGPVSAANSSLFGDDEPNFKDQLARRREAAEPKVAAASPTGPKAG
ncbi:hypothetical protein MASR1M60_33170 [Rhodocyclaceae bacterium]